VSLKKGIKLRTMIPTVLKVLGLLQAIRDCGKGEGRATLLDFKSQPEAPVAGDNVTLWVAYDLPEPVITGGTATYKFDLNGIPFPPTVDDLCTQTTCPKEVGFNNESSWSIFPSGVSGKIVSTIDWKDQNDDLVWCVETTWRV
jgi:hypothetical protein